MLSRVVMTTALAGLLAGGAITGAQAQQPASSGQQAANSSGWTFNIAPYGWFANINVTSNLPLPPALGGTVTTDSSIGFGDLLSHLNFAAMVAADAQYGRFSVVTDFMYLNVGGAASDIRSVNFFGLSPIPISGAVRKSAGVNLNTKIWTLAGGYTIVQGDWGNFDVIAGFRYLGIPISVDYSLDLALTGPRGNGATFGGIGNVSGTAAIWNGIGGFRGRIRLRRYRAVHPLLFRRRCRRLEPDMANRLRHRLPDRLGRCLAHLPLSVLPAGQQRGDPAPVGQRPDAHGEFHLLVQKDAPPA